jgi:hypothetical protein
MAERRVWIAQCLCGPNRHAIAANADEFDSETEARKLLRHLRNGVAELRRGGINPWCAICGSVEAAWRYELARTPFRTMEEAGPELAKLAAGALANLLLGSHGPDRPGSA